MNRINDSLPDYSGKVVLLPNSIYMEVTHTVRDPNIGTTVLIGTTYKFGYIPQEPILSVTGLTEYILNQWDAPEYISTKQFYELFRTHLNVKSSSVSYYVS